MDHPVGGSESGVNGRPWFWRLEYVSDGSEPASDQTEVWIYENSGDYYRRSYYFSK